MKQIYLDKAKEFANSFEKPKDNCPRDVINPGLYFGFLEGVRAVEELINQKDAEISALELKLALILRDKNI